MTEEAIFEENEKGKEVMGRKRVDKRKQQDTNTGRGKNRSFSKGKKKKSRLL